MLSYTTQRETSITTLSHSTPLSFYASLTLLLYNHFINILLSSRLSPNHFIQYLHQPIPLPLSSHALPIPINQHSLTMSKFITKNITSRRCRNIPHTPPHPSSSTSPARACDRSDNCRYTCRKGANMRTAIAPALCVAR